jgi:hypothetical protein
MIAYMWIAKWYQCSPYDPMPVWSVYVSFDEKLTNPKRLINCGYDTENYAYSRLKLEVEACSCWVEKVIVFEHPAKSEHQDKMIGYFDFNQ